MTQKEPTHSRTFLQGLAALPGDVFRAGVLLAAFSSLLGAIFATLGAFSMTLDVASHFALAGLYVSLICLLIASLFRGYGRRTLLVVCALGCGLWVAPLAPEYFAAWTARRVPVGADTLKLVQFNLWRSNVDIDGTVAGLLAEDADVLVLEEVASSTVNIVNALREHYPHSLTCSPPYPCSTVIMTKVQPQEAGGYAIPYGKANLAWVTLEDSRGAPFTVVGVHHSWPHPLGAQPAQNQWTAQILEGFDQDSLILAGDFNSTPWSHALRRQDRLFGLERRTLALPTFPARVLERWPKPFPMPLMPIDHVYAGGAWRTVEVRRGKRLGSDHYPVVVRLWREPSMVATPGAAD